MQWSKVGTKLVTGSGDGKVRIWNATLGKELQSQCYDSVVRIVAWNADASKILIYTADRTIHVWNL